MQPNNRHQNAALRLDSQQVARVCGGRYTYLRMPHLTKFFVFSMLLMSCYRSYAIEIIGDVIGYVAVVKPGSVIFEMGAVPKNTAEEALRLASHKLPIKTRFVSKES